MKFPLIQKTLLELNTSRICGLLSLAFGLAALIGWTAGLPLLHSFGSGLIPMAPSTAILFLLYGTGVFSLDPKVPEGWGWPRRLQTIIASSGTLISASLYLVSSWNIRLKAEHLGFSIAESVNGSPVGHISPLTAFCFVLIGFSFLTALASNRKRNWLAAVSVGFASFVVLIGVILLLAYLLGSPFLYLSGVIPPALPTSLGLLTLSLSLLTYSGRPLWSGAKQFRPRRTKAENSLILIFLGLSLGIIIAGYFYFRTFEKHHRFEINRQLSAVADLKVRELVQWRKERTGDAELLYNNPNFSGLTRSYLQTPKDPELRLRLMTWLEKFQTAYGYERVFLLDVEGVERMGFPETPSTDLKCLREHIPEVFRSGKVTFLDFHREAEDRPIHLSVLVPIFEDQNDKRPLGMVVLRINPDTYLFPLINRWPGDSQTAETLLVRREGTEVLFLNDLRFQKNTALNLRRPLSDFGLPAARAVLGQEGIIEGIDYRGIPVIAYLCPVPGSPWFLVSRMDQSEIFAPLRAKLWETSIIIVILLFSAAAGLGLVWRQQRLLYYRERLQAAEREQHLMAVLDAVRKVNQLIIREKDRDLLLQEACTILTSSRGFNSVWIGLADESGKFFKAAESGLSGGCLVLLDLKRQEEWPPCIKDSLSRKGPMVLEKRAPSCRNCPLEECHGDLGTLIIRLDHWEKAYGLMLVSLPQDLIMDQEEQDLFKEVAGDIAFALNVISQEESKAEAEAALHKSEEKMKTLFENAPDAIYLYDLQGRLLDGNKAAEEMSGYKKEELIGNNFLEIGLLPMEEVEKTAQLLLKNTQGLPTGPDPLTLIRKDGQRVTIETRTFPLRIGKEIMVLAIARDISDRLRLEEQMRQSQKMEAVGRLTAGVAHDFNNLLTTILGNAQMTLMELKKGEDLYELAQEIKEAGDRAAALIRQLLAFSRKQVFQAEVLDLNEVISDLKSLLSRLAGEHISLETHLDSDLGAIESDLSQMEQVIVNLVVNARDAMEQGGKLTIETGNIDLDQSYASGHIEVTPGPYVLLSVSDTGCGMTPEVRSQIFEPFFTTKEKGKGTGLGLSTVYGVIKQSRGNIWVYSEPQKGTTFKIYLPRTDKATTSKKEDNGPEPALKGSETVLLVEDDAGIRKMVIKALEGYGYRVLSAEKGTEAFQLFQDHIDHIDLILTDVVMPGWSGKELTDHIKTLRPETAVLYMSGYTDNAIVHHGFLDQEVDFIEKPFTPEVLVRKVRMILDRGGPKKETPDD